MINDIHQDIVRLIEHMLKIIQINNVELRMHKVKKEHGLNIDNYIFDLGRIGFRLKHSVIFQFKYR